jgi:hypothetical protein
MLAPCSPGDPSAIRMELMDVDRCLLCVVPHIASTNAASVIACCALPSTGSTFFKASHLPPPPAYLTLTLHQVMRRARASVGQEDLAQYVKWTAEFGQEG